MKLLLRHALIFTAFCLAVALPATGRAQASAACRAATPTEAAFYTTPMAMPRVISPKDGTCYVPDLSVTMPDGVALRVNLFLPAGASSGTRKYPGIVFISSWAMAEFFEYTGQQYRLARDGYVSASYTARGFWNSQGVIKVAAPEDIADVSRVIDWTLANAPLDGARIGTSGISYGAGIGLLASAQDARIRAVAAMSGWGLLADQLYGNDTANPTWLNLLVSLGKVTGRMDGSVLDLAATALNPDITQPQLADLRAWALIRSPNGVVEGINRNRPAVFIAKNWQDEMFSPNSSLALFSQITGPKRLMLQPGIHGVPEGLGAILDVPNDTMDQAHAWFDRWLKGVPNGIDLAPQVVLKRKFGNSFESLSTWPAPELGSQTYALVPRGNLRWNWSCFCTKGFVGGLSATGTQESAVDRINNALDTTATTGPLPVMSVAVEATTSLPVLNQQDSILRDQGVRYEGPFLSQPMQLRGSPKLRLSVVPSQRRGMVVAYLYDVDALGWGTLITHGARSLHWATPGVRTDLSFDLNAIAYDIPAGHRVALVFDTVDHLYGAPVAFGERFEMGLVVGNGSGATLTLPKRG